MAKKRTLQKRQEQALRTIQTRGSYVTIRAIARELKLPVNVASHVVHTLSDRIEPHGNGADDYLKLKSDSP